MTIRRKEVRAPFAGALTETIDSTSPEKTEQAMALAHRLFGDRNVWLSPALKITGPAAQGAVSADV